MKLRPASSAISIWAWPSASVFWLPQVMVPRQISVTSRSVRPSGFNFIAVYLGNWYGRVATLTDVGAELTGGRAKNPAVKKASSSLLLGLSYRPRAPIYASRRGRGRSDDGPFGTVID